MIGISYSHGISTAFAKIVEALWTLQAEPDGRVSLRDVSAAVDITVSDTQALDGRYSVNWAALAAGPLNLAPPSLDGSGVMGEVLHARDGLWICAEQTSPMHLEYQWQRNGVTLAGHTSPVFISTQADVGAQITVRQTATDGLRTQSAVSAPILIEGAQFVDAFDYSTPTVLGDLPYYTSHIISGTGRIKAQDGIARGNRNDTFEVIEYTGGTLSPNQFCTLTLGADSGDNVTLLNMLRFDGVENWYGASSDSKGVRLVKQVAGVYSVLTGSVPLYSDDVLRFDVRGTLLRLTQNGSEVLSVNDTDLAQGSAAFLLKQNNTMWVRDLTSFACGDL